MQGWAPFFVLPRKIPSLPWPALSLLEFSNQFCHQLAPSPSKNLSHPSLPSIVFVITHKCYSWQSCTFSSLCTLERKIVAYFGRLWPFFGYVIANLSTFWRTFYRRYIKIGKCKIMVCCPKRRSLHSQEFQLVHITSIRNLEIVSHGIL